MEISCTKEELMKTVSSLKDGQYHVIIVKENPINLNQVHFLIRKIGKNRSIFFNDMKQMVKDDLGLFYLENGEKKYRSFSHLSSLEIETLINYLNGL